MILHSDGHVFGYSASFCFAGNIIFPAKYEFSGQKPAEIFTLLGILVFTNKVIARGTANKIRRAVEMTVGVYAENVIGVQYK